MRAGEGRLDVIWRKNVLGMMKKEKKNVLSMLQKNMAESGIHQPGRLKKKKRKEVRKMDKNCQGCVNAGGCQITENMICHPQILVTNDFNFRAERRIDFTEPVEVSFIVNNPKQEKPTLTFVKSKEENGQRNIFSVLAELNSNFLGLYGIPFNLAWDFINACRKY